jgi:hypothetical protein
MFKFKHLFITEASLFQQQNISKASEVTSMGFNFQLKSYLVQFAKLCLAGL